MCSIGTLALFVLFSLFKVKILIANYKFANLQIFTFAN